MTIDGKHTIRTIAITISCGIIATAIGTIISLYFPTLKLKNLFGIFWNHLTLKTTLPRGLIYLAYLLLLLLLLKLIRKLKSNRCHPLPYTEDELFGALWRWILDSNNKPTNLTCYCPTCDMQLITKSGSSTTYFKCERCEEDLVRRRPNISTEDFVGRIRREIERKIRTGEWKKRSRDHNSIKNLLRKLLYMLKIPRTEHLTTTSHASFTDAPIHRKITNSLKITWEVKVSSVEQKFIVYFSFRTDKNEKIWVGFTNRPDGTGRSPDEHTQFIGFSDRINYKYEGNIMRIIKERWPRLQNKPIKIDEIRLRGDKAIHTPVYFHCKFTN